MDSPRVLVLAASLISAALSAGCGGAGEATEKQLSEVRAELLKLRADNAALSERLDGVELRASGPRGVPTAPAPVAENGPKSEPPELDVVRLVPEPANADDPMADGPRPVLRGTGKVGTVEEVPGARPGQTPSPKAAGPASTTPRR